MAETEGELDSFVPWHLVVANFLLQDNCSHGLTHILRFSSCGGDLDGRTNTSIDPLATMVFSLRMGLVGGVYDFFAELACVCQLLLDNAYPLAMAQGP
jgi:hypothetical protein